jgi:dihydroxyacetone kinase-like predicted kinase
MREAAESITSGELTSAVRDATTEAGAIREGDWLGLVDGKVRLVTPSGRVTGWRGALGRVVGGGADRRRRRGEERRAAAFERALIGLFEEVVGPEAEVVTLVTGRDAEPAVTEAARRWLSAERPEVVADVVDGGQPLYPYLIGVE